MANDIQKQEFIEFEKNLLGCFPESISSAMKGEGNFFILQAVKPIQNTITQFENMVEFCMNENGTVNSKLFIEALSSFVPKTDFRLVDIVSTMSKYLK